MDGNVTVAFAHSAIKCDTADTQNRGRTSNTATTHDEDEAERNMQESIKLGRYQDTVRTPIVAQVNLHYFFFCYKYCVSLNQTENGMDRAHISIYSECEKWTIVIVFTTTNKSRDYKIQLEQNEKKERKKEKYVNRW